MNAEHIVQATVLRALAGAELPAAFRELEAKQPERRPLALALLRLAERATLAEIRAEVARVVERLQGLAQKDGKDSARRLGEKFWQPLQREIERQTELAEEPLLLESESLWEGVGPLRRAALCKGLRALFGGAEPSLGAAFLSERLRLQLRARARAWLDEERESRSTEKGGRSWNG